MEQMTDLTPLTRSGVKPNPAGRRGVSMAMARLLDEGRRFTDTEADLEPEQLRSWSARLSKLSTELADCVETPLRNRLMEYLSASWTDDDENALRGLRLGLLGNSVAKLGEATGISGRTIERVESGRACQVRTAWRLASHFALRTTELFESPSGEEGLYVRGVGDLREAMASVPPHSWDPE